jgi:hypothetical protein
MCFELEPVRTATWLGGVFAAALTLPLGSLWSQTPPVMFRDVADEAGLDFSLENHATQDKHLIETMPGGIAAFDFDGDGLTDIYFTNGASVPDLRKEHRTDWNRLYRNLGNMKFADVTEKAGVAGSGYSIGAAAADYDNDGDVDLFVAGVGRNVLYRNAGDGTFVEVARQAGLASTRWSVAGSWFDYDNDGWLDLFVVNYLQWSPEFHTYCGDTVAKVRSYCHPRLLDGLPNSLYRNNGDGSFTDVSAKSGIAEHVGKGMSAAVADYDGDGFLDVFVTNDREPNFLFHNSGHGAFTEEALWAGCALQNHGKAVSGMGADFRDYNNDGLPDIVFSALAGDSYPIFRNSGDGLFEDATFASALGPLSQDLSGWSIGLFDFNNDGTKDLFVAQSHVNDTVEHFEASRYKLPNSIFVNSPEGKFRDASAASGLHNGPARAHRGAAFADFNNDGRIDVVVSSLGEKAELWENATAAQNNWLALKLRGMNSNRDGIGAVIQIGDQRNHMTTSVGYASSSYSGVHFGLGRAENVDRIEIRWPSGAKQVLTEVQSNQVLEVTEPVQGEPVSH